MEAATLNEEAIVIRARVAGYDLVQRELDTGNLVWTLVGHDDADPCFLTRRAAITWLQDRLQLDGRLL